MLKIQDIFICDSIKEGQFSKTDIVGFNGSGIIGVNSIPYRLITYVIIRGEADANIPELNLNLSYLNNKSEETTKQTFLITEKIKNSEEKALFFIFTTSILLTEYGTLIFTVLSSKKTLFEKKYKIKFQPAPSLKNPSHIQSSVLVTRPSDVSSTFLIDLFSQANKSIKIIDNYLTPDSLLSLLLKVDKNVEICIITKTKFKTQFANELIKFSAYPKLSVKFSENSHDRFFILNGTEYYHSGHSLKDIAKGKAARLSKITGLHETQKLFSFFETEWKAGAIL